MSKLPTLALGIICIAAPVFGSNQLSGRYLSLCGASGYKDSSAVATQSTLTFSNGILEHKQHYYRDPACKQFPIPDLEETNAMSYNIGNAVPNISFPQGLAYKITFTQANEKIDYCFYLGRFSTGEEALFISKPWDARKDSRCYPITDQVWVKQ